MPNLSYNRSRKRELALKLAGEKEGWYAIRAAGSHGVADVIWLRPCLRCGCGDCYQGKLIQVKTGAKIKKEKIDWKVEKSSCGLVNVCYYYYPANPRKRGG